MNVMTGHILVAPRKKRMDAETSAEKVGCAKNTSFYILAELSRNHWQT